MLQEISMHIYGVGKAVLGMALIGTIAELFLPYEKQTWLSRLRAFGFWCVYLVAAACTAILVQALLRYAGITPLFNVNVSDSVNSDSLVWVFLGYTIFPFLGSLVGDFFYYWFHRLQHVLPFLWRFHSTHHAIEELNAFNSYHHPLEDLLRTPFITLPIALLFSMSIPQFMVIAWLLYFYTALAHANTRVSYGPLKYIFVEPQFHRLHHSIAREHYDRNFSFTFAIWDILFGTAMFPRKGETIKTGIKGQPEARTLGEYVIPRRKKTPARESAGGPAPLSHASRKIVGGGEDQSAEAPVAT